MIIHAIRCPITGNTEVASQLVQLEDFITKKLAVPERKRAELAENAKQYEAKLDVRFVLFYNV